MCELGELRKRIFGDKACIWLFNICAENIWHPDTNSEINENIGFLSQLESMSLLLCREDDYIVFRNMPNKKLLRHLKEQGIHIPHMIVPSIKNKYDSVTESVLADPLCLQKLKRLQHTHMLLPFAVTRLEEKLAMLTGVPLVGASEKIAIKVNSKIFARNMAIKLGYDVCVGEIYQNPIRAFEDYKFNNCNTKVILKKAYGASGTGLYIIENEKQFKRIIERCNRNTLTENCILEKFYENKLDINYQIFISKEGEIIVYSVKQQIVRGTKYVGSIQPLIVSSELYNQILVCGEAVGKELYKEGYWGIASVDGMIYNNRIIPILEINGRMSLSTYTSFGISGTSCEWCMIKYYDFYLDDYDSGQIERIYEVVEETIEIKCIIYAYAYDFELSCNQKHKLRIFLLYLGIENEGFKEKIEIFESVLRSVIRNEKHAVK